MKTSREVLKILTENQGEPISGEKLAEKLNISRSAVWKAVGQLRRDGHIINAATNKGYVLEEKSCVLSAPAVEKYLENDIYSIDVRSSVTSTNTVLRAKAEEGAPEFSVLIAGSQSAGRGRMGRTFHSPSGSGIYMSILLRPKLSAMESLRLTTCAAVACAKALEKISGRKTMIKWVNDIYIDNKKVCGILTEASVDFESGGLSYAVLGIGINIMMPKGGFPDDIKQRAGSLFEYSEEKNNLREKTAAEVLNTFAMYYDCTGGVPADKDIVLKEYRERSLVTGKEIDILYPDREEHAKAVGIDDEFRLIAELADGKTVHLSSGDVSLRVN